MRSALLTDLYEITMAYGYWSQNMAERQAVFTLSFRTNPLQSPFAIACGLGAAIEYLQNFHFQADDIDYLQSLKSIQDQPLFSRNFLQYLSDLRFSCDIDAMPEGEIIFPQEPVLRIKGPLLQCQLFETVLMNFVNFSTLIATKAAQICHAADGDPVIEFGLRRAQGPNGGMLASRAAYVGGCEATSNVLAGKTYNIPVRGTMAHSWIMAFEDEVTAFEKFAAVMPQNTILLIDTYDTIQGVKNAIDTGNKLKKLGHKLLAVRLDSGDLNQLSQKTRALLDGAGFLDTKIMASGDLNAEKITNLKRQKAPIDLWGVGTQLVTAYDDPALDATYKLSAIQDVNDAWLYKLKRSEQEAKISNPGILQVRRYFKNKEMLTDVIYDMPHNVLDKNDFDSNHYRDLLVPVFKSGQLVYEVPTLSRIRSYCINQIQQFNPFQLINYPVQFDTDLQSIKQQLLKKIQDKLL